MSVTPNSLEMLGLSCQKCSRGYMREDLVHISSFSSCVACDCSKRGITDPPECDELTGSCFNCRNGTTGAHCELCSPHVVGPDCDRCENTYWGLEADGCRECNCSYLGATAKVCDPDSGQCNCTPNVIGRTCDQCKENFYNISINGCIECDSCYALLKDAILPLRQHESEISSNITFLKTNNITSINGAFMTRYLEATKQTKQLTDFQSEANIKTTIQDFNRTISSIETEIYIILNNKTFDIERLLSTSEVIINTAQTYQSIIENNTVFVYNKLASLQGSQSTLSNLANSLKTVQQYLISVANSSFIDQQILSNLSTLNNTLFLANNLVNEAQQKADVASQIHKNNTSALLALETRIITLSNEADKVLISVQSLGANDLLATAIKLKSQLSLFLSFTLDNSSLVDKLITMRTDITSLQTLLTSEATFFNTSNVNALATVPRTDDLSNQSRIIGFSSSEWVARSNTASQRASSFQTQATTMLKDANKTLLTLNNFKFWVEDYLQQVNTLNVTVSPAVNQSVHLIQKSQNFTQTLALLQQTASAAKEYSQQALTMISLRQKEFQTVTAESSQLQTRLNDIVDLSTERFKVLNNTKLNVNQPADLKCRELNSSIISYQAQLSSTQQAVETSLLQIANLTQRAHDIIGQLQSLNKIDSASISVLFSNVQSAQNVFNLDDLRKIISNLLDKKNVQNEKINKLKSIKDNLKSKIQSLKAFQSQIINT
ncbi:hypothetical protein Btru_016072 [Bulinus truncatus]|nr:hypothetical protein Btru_016072 [Bulinus truncatus]